MKDTKKLLKLTFIFLLIIGIGLILLEPVSYSSSLLDNARDESGTRPPTYGTDDPTTPDPEGDSGSSSGNVTIVKSGYRGIMGRAYERTDNSSEIDGIEIPRVGIERGKSNSIQQYNF
ncbi:MAG: hypothetical protein IJ629_04480 [Clostridia bacterium]|nr:hypothetical protein [Clostridia bacterium]